MNTYEFKLPDIGEGVTEGEVVKWLVKPGERVAEDQPMVEVMTDKATVTITSPRTGMVLETRGTVGAIVPVHAVLVVLDLGGDGAPAAAHAPAPASQGSSIHVASHVNSDKSDKDAGPAATAVGDIRETLPGMSLMSSPAAHAPGKAASSANGHGAASAQVAYFNEKPLATPATRKLARDLDIDLRSVPPTGPGGRVTKDDLRLLGTVSSSSAAAATQVAQPASKAPSPQSVAVVPTDERVPLRGVRKRIFEGMSRSTHTAAHFTFVEECDATALIALRERLRPAADKAGVKLTYLAFITKAVVAALAKHPTLASAFDESTQEIVVRKARHIGVAASTDAGLIVPVVRDADRKSILEVARDIQRLGEDAKSGKVRADDLGGSIFTITSLGAQGGLFATPILNFPEVGILGVHKIKERPVVRDGQIVIGQVMLLSLSFDHRIIDGHVGAAFAYDVIAYLENPDLLILEL